MYPILTLASLVVLLPIHYADNITTFLKGSKLRTRRAQVQRQGIMSVVLGLMIAVFIGAILVEEFETVIDAQREGASANFNSTADDIVSYTWITFTFLALGILIVGGAWILRQSGMIG